MIPRRDRKFDKNSDKKMARPIDNPDAIFEVPARLGTSNRFSYSVRPTFDPDEPENVTLPRYGFAFLAYLKRVDSEYLLYNWLWRKKDPYNPGFPAERDDLGRQLWPQI